MSDLISRSELIENFRKCYSGHLGMENSDACMTFHGICNVINNTNTVYNVDKVVEELPDDVCEWELKNACYTTSIKHYYSLPTSIVKTFNNCPYCGKKIKGVEHGKNGT